MILHREKLKIQKSVDDQRSHEKKTKKKKPLQSSPSNHQLLAYGYHCVALKEI